MEPNGKLRLLTGSKATEHDVWLLAGDQIAAAKEHPLGGDNAPHWIDTQQARSAHVAYRAARRHNLIDDDMSEQDFVDTVLIDMDAAEAPKKKDGSDPLELSGEATPDASST